MKTKRKTVSLLAIMALVCLSISLAIAVPVRAGVSGSEGGALYSANYSVGAGGQVIMQLKQSDDCVIIGDAPADSKTVTGSASGAWPASADMGDSFIAQGYITLGRIEITAGSGYQIENLTVNGESQGAVASYDFSGTANTFAVTFVAEATSAPTTAATTAATTAVTATTVAATTAAPTTATATTGKTTVTTEPVGTEPAAGAVTETLAPTTIVESTMESPIETVISVQETLTLTAETSIIKDEGPEQSGWPWWQILLLVLFILLLLLLLLYYIMKKIRGRGMKEEQK